MRALRRVKAIVVTCAAAAALLLAPAPAARASLGFQDLSFSLDSAPPVGAEPGAVGPPEVQAGSHPYQMTIGFAFDRTTDSQGEQTQDEAAKDLQIELPPGLIGSLARTPQCPPEAFATSSFSSSGCPASSQVGTLVLKTAFFAVSAPVFNLEPPSGDVGQLGVFAVITPVFMGISVRTGGDYGLTVSMHNLPQFLPVSGGSLSLWGVPADEGHDTLRGRCLGAEGESTGRCPSDAPRKPFLTLPSSCGGPPQVRFRADSWEQPGAFVSGTAVPRDGEGDALGLAGCERLDFSPTVEVKPESTLADAPSGLALAVQVPQSENPDGLAEADVREAAVSLPRGVSINPAAADGLSACLPAEIDLGSPAPPRCPDASRIGSVLVRSQLVAEPLQGSVYLAVPGGNELESPLAVYVTAQQGDALIKLAGRLEADPDTGQLTLALDRMPQLPFSELVLSFDGGPRAPLAMPTGCGTFTVRTRLTPYSAPDGGAPATPSSGFAVERGCGGGFSPSFLGGATSALAGRRTGLTLGLARADGEQPIRGFSATLPVGLLPLLGDVPPCVEPWAAAGSCAPSSQIGSVAIAAGAGPHPFYFAGKVFLSGPYKGAPFGLWIVVPAVAGPFDLGVVVVRARVSVDPLDARLTIATDPFPRILRGIPLRIRSLDLTSGDRPGLFLAPTRCERQQVSATALGAAGASASLSSPFFLAGCAGLRFSPRISASAKAPVTRAGGVDLGLTVRNPRGAQANLRAISVTFPRQLSPRLSAIQAACAKATFAVDPASCPAASVVGGASVRASILDVPLAGPAYLVSRGGEALPRLVLVLQGRGVLLRIAGSLRASDSGATTATFAAMPDASISSFAIRLPRGPRSALGANFLDRARGSLCGRDLTMPVRVVAQNGARVERSVDVSLSGCAGKASGSSR